jgi:hypothetical protein
MIAIRQRRHWAWIVGGGLLLLIVAISSVAFLNFDSRTIPRSTYDQIKKGMTLSEVETLLGTPTRKALNPTSGVPIAAATVAEWRRGGSRVILGFDDADRMQSGVYLERTVLEALGDKFEALTGWN